MMRIRLIRNFEVKAAWALGIALPVLEAARRRTHFHPIVWYIDDFIAGGLLIWAAVATQRGFRYGRFLLCAAWGVLCGGLYSSFFSQVELGRATDISGLANQYVVLVKGFLFALALTGLVQSIRRSPR